MAAQTSPISGKSISERLQEYVRIYLASHSLGDELEVRFATKHYNPMTRIKFESVISKLKSLGFTSENGEGTYYLNIQNDFIHSTSGKTLIGRIRTRINGLQRIRQYCLTNRFDFEQVPPWVWFEMKSPKLYEGERLRPIDYHDFQFRVNFKEEKRLRSEYDIVQTLLRKWDESKKTFRLIKRFSFEHKLFPVRVDCSIVRTSKRRGRHLVPEFRIEASGVFNNPESYEVEIEILPKKQLKQSYDAASLLFKLKQVIKYVLAGLQNTNFPVSYIEQEQVLKDYMQLLHGQAWESRRITSRDFVGPSSISLERINIAPLSGDSSVPNIRSPYTVTEKADGIRKLLYISPGGRIYLIDINMAVQFTGMATTQAPLKNTILDGEHVLHNKEGSFINRYLAFDIYYLHGDDIRSEAFYSKEGGGDGETRINRLNGTVKRLAPRAVSGASSPLRISAKKFYYSDGDAIFGNCGLILGQEKRGLFDYEIDGLIFTPTNKGVGSDKIGQVLPPVKTTWPSSMKWKPEKYNTIDFLVTTQKTESGDEFIGSIFQDGDNMYLEEQLTEFKRLVLRVGFNERTHGYLNPCEDVAEDKLPEKQARGGRGTYRPVPFYPVDPTPAYPGYLANVLMENVGGTKHMMTESKTETFEDNMIVEFKYDKSAAKFWQWVPIRVRLDKTTEYRAGRKNYGNAYHVAQSVWRSIHNPVTREMISTGDGIPDLLVDEDVYYNRKSKSTITRALRDFHNLFVKRVLILAVSNKGDTLIDMTVGKGGDFSKWIAAKLSFVFGLDISRDNIENRLDGACARFLNYRKRFHVMPYALFVNANSSLNIRSGEACFTERGKAITRAIFGEGPKDPQKLGAGVYRQYAKGKAGFNIVSNQFSIHYFFKNVQILNAFLQNISECCKVGGYFIGTSYDGRRVFQRLESKSLGEGIFIMAGETKMWEIKKQYENDRFENNRSCVGYQVDVYQESINKIFSEYLVNYEYLTSLIENYGFVPLTSEEAHKIGLPASIGNFSELYNLMEERIRQRKLRLSDVGKAGQMNANERKISDLNKYFVYKKVREVNAGQIAAVLSNQSPSQLKLEEKTNKALDEIPEAPKPKVVKQKKKIRLGRRRKVTVSLKPQIPTLPAPGPNPLGPAKKAEDKPLGRI